MADIQKKDFEVEELQCGNQFWNSPSSYVSCEVIRPIGLVYSCSTNLLYEKIYFQCSHSNVVPYIALMSSWFAYFAVLFFACLCWTLSYHTNDFRFIITNDQFSISTTGIVLCYIGYLFTFGTAAVGIFFSNSHHKGYEMIIVNISFVIGNIFAIKSLFIIVLEMPPRRIHMQTDFPKEVLYHIPSDTLTDAYDRFKTLQESVKIFSYTFSV